jgi:hypothetical protein
MERMEKEERLLAVEFPGDWARYRLSYVVRRTRGIDADTIYRGDNYVKHHIYSFPRNQYRMLKSLLGIRKLSSFVAIYKFNKAVKKGWQGSHYFREYPATFESPPADAPPRC